MNAIKISGNYPSNKVKIYDAEYLNYEDSTLLPGFLIPDDNDEFSIHESEGHFGFFNSSGTQFHVLVKARNGSGLINGWAVVTVDVE
ncbi:MAG: hypothetical protein DRI89_08825 [Bacteroidetes bacterium]|nr:MAG: hypothetical protein DRI89_08825 [Bacteroidota bacterium]